MCSLDFLRSFRSGDVLQRGCGTGVILYVCYLSVQSAVESVKQSQRLYA
jgi:hypothetical protein